MFTPDAELSSYTAWAMRIYMAASGIFGIQIACQQSFVALGQAKVAIFLALLRKVILLIPLILLLPRLAFLKTPPSPCFSPSPSRTRSPCARPPRCSSRVSANSLPERKMPDIF